jgi:hypothetical protein
MEQRIIHISSMGNGRLRNEIQDSLLNNGYHQKLPPEMIGLIQRIKFESEKRKIIKPIYKPSKIILP